MTLPTGRYAALGPPVPADGMPDGPPLWIGRINLLPDRNHLGEAIVMIDAASATMPRHRIKMILCVNPHLGEITRPAVLDHPAAGYVTCRPAVLPGNLVDIVRTIALEARSDC